MSSVSQTPATIPVEVPRWLVAVEAAGVAAGGMFTGFTFHLLRRGFEQGGSLEGEARWQIPELLGMLAATLLWALESGERARTAGETRVQAMHRLAPPFLIPLVLSLPAAQVMLGILRTPVGLSFLFLLAVSVPLGAVTGPWLARRARSGGWALVAGVALFSLAFSFLSLKRYQFLEWGYADSGCVAEVLHNTISGRFLYTHAFSFENYFGDHFSPILILMLPIFALIPGHETLIVMHAVAIGLGAIPVFLMVRHVTGSSFCGLALALAYLMSPPVQMQTTNHSYGFKCSSVAIPFLLGAIYCALSGRSGWLLTFCLLALSCEESVAPAVLTLGLWVALRGQWRMGAAITLGSLLWFLVATRWIMPAITGGKHFQVALFYGHLGSSMGEILRHLLMHPGETFQMIFRHQSFLLLLHLTAPLALLPFLRPQLLLLGLPTFLFLCFSRQEAFLSYQFQYKATLIPVVFLAAAGALARTPGWVSRWLYRPSGRAESFVPHCLGAAALSASLLSCVFYGNLPISWVYVPPGDHNVAAASVVAEAKTLVPRNAAILCSERLASHFTDCRDVFRMRNVPAARFDYVAFDLLSDWPLSQAEHDLLADTLRGGEFRPILAREGIVLLKRGGKIPEELKDYGLLISPVAGLFGEALGGLARVHIDPGRMEGHNLVLPVVWEALRQPDLPYLVEVTIVTSSARADKLFPLCRGIWPMTLWETGRQYKDDYVFNNFGGDIQSVHVQFRLIPPAFALEPAESFPPPSNRSHE